MAQEHLSIDLNKLQANLEAVKACIPESTQVWPVIKDDAYGHGAEVIAGFLESSVQGFCVVRVTEGIRLREVGIRCPILVFESPRKDTVKSYTSYDLIASVSSPLHIEILDSGTHFHVNIDTGMKRLGAPLASIPELITSIHQRSDCKGTGIYTHFVHADDPGSPRVLEQLSIFKKIRSQFPEDWMTHTANSGAIFHYAKELDVSYDMVRPGVCMYGYSAGDKAIDELQPILSWATRLIHIQPVEKGETVSYGGRWTAPEHGFVGVIPVGYAHGLSRLLSNRIQVLIDGNLHEQVGSITMDFSMIWLGENSYSIDTEVILLDGVHLRANDWAKLSDTIAYEITTRLSPNLPRTYLGNDQRLQS